MGLYPNETRILFSSLTQWLEMAEKRLELMERELDEASSSDDDHPLQRTKVGMNLPRYLLLNKNYMV